MKKILLSAFLLLGTTLASRAQSAIGIDTSSYTYNASTSFNSLEQFAINLVNYGPQAYTGPLTIMVAVDSTASGFSFNVTGDSSGVSVSGLGPGAMLPDTFTITINNLYRSGINTVVIWPRSSNSNFITNDSLRLPLLVTGVAGIAAQGTAIHTRLFPNPAGNRLWITSADPAFIIERVRIFDSSLRLLKSVPWQGSLSLEDLPRGVYYLELRDAAQKSVRHKLIKD
jgi:hypothetical protein